MYRVIHEETKKRPGCVLLVKIKTKVHIRGVYMKLELKIWTLKEIHLKEQNSNSTKLLQLSALWNAQNIECYK